MLATGTTSSASINYLSRSSYERLRLIQSDGDVIGQLLQLLAEYEGAFTPATLPATSLQSFFSHFSLGVLARKESFAANLGGKLTAPRLIKAVESAFEGPILTSPPHSAQAPNSVRWPDIIQYARANPSGITTGTLPGGGRVCQFHLKGVQVEVMEDDWRLIATGALDGMIPEGPLEEDEAAELATVDILEARLEGVTRAAEEAVARAKNLAFALAGRRSGILARGEAHGSARGFQAVNDGHPGIRRKKASGRAGPMVGEAGDLHAELLKQFSATSPSPNAFPRPVYTIATGPHMAGHVLSPIPNHAAPHPAYPIVSPTTRYPPLAPSGRLPAPTPPSRKDSVPDEADSAHRPLIMSMVETLGKGEGIAPPCDRCRRLRQGCVKHLTACQGCTRKHAKCTWRNASEAEIAGLRARREAGRRGEVGSEGVGAGDGEGGKRDGAEVEAGARERTGRETPLSRMDIDAITTQDEPRKGPGTGLPRNPNFLGSADGEERGGRASSVAAQGSV